MTAVNLPPMALAAPVANSGSVAVGYPDGFVQADFTGANASADGQVAVNDNDVYLQTEGHVGIGYGASTITVTNTTGQTWPLGARLRVQASRQAAGDTGGGAATLTAATLVATMAEAAAHATLGRQLGEQVDVALAARDPEDQLAALVARGALALAEGETPVEDDLLAFDAAGAVKSAASSPAGLSIVTEEVSILVFEATEDVATGDGAGGVFFRVPSTLDGMVLVAAAAQVQTAGTTGTTDVQVARIRAGTPADMLSTKVTIDSAEIDSSTATAAVIDAANDDVATGDQLRIDVDAVSTTPPKGLLVELQFRAA